MSSPTHDRSPLDDWPPRHFQALQGKNTSVQYICCQKVGGEEMWNGGDILFEKCTSLFHCLCLFHLMQNSTFPYKNH